MPATAVTISSQSKRKLKSFEFQSAKKSSNLDETTPDRQTRLQNPDRVRLQEDIHADEDEAEARSCPFPNTPANRITFADLIANPEDALSRIITATPNAQVEWRHVPGSSEAASSVRASQRGQKRVHSSSPPSSSAVRRVKHFRDEEPLDLDSITRSLQTPKQDDPVLALWSRYADSHERGDPHEPALPPLPPMSSSPNTPNHTRKDESLRRTASCGIEWPKSATKRRKWDRDPYIRTKGIFAANKSVILGKDHPRNSRVSILVDSIQQSLGSRSTNDVEGPSSSSPVPDRHQVPAFSPLQQAPEVVANANSHGARDDMCDRIADGGQQAGSSDFGDMDFDMDDPDLLRVLEHAGTQTEPGLTDMHPRSQPSPDLHIHNQASKSAQQTSKPSEDDYVTQNLSNFAQTSKSSHPSAKDSRHVPGSGEFEEFEDDDDDDQLVTELAELAKKVDSQDLRRPAERDSTTQHTQLSNLHENKLFDDFDDAFDDDGNGDNDDMWNEIASTSALAGVLPAKSTNLTHNNHKAIKRYLILTVSEGTFQTAQGRRSPEKILLIKDEKSGQKGTILLRQSWYDTRCVAGSYVHLVGEFDHQRICIVDDKDNMLILHPDHLISATVVADSFTCVRRAALQDRVKATNPAEAPQVYGHFIHEVFGEALKQNSWTLGHLRSIIEKLVPTYIESFYEIGVQPPDAIEYVMSKMPDLIGWANVFVNTKPVPEAQIRDRNGTLVPTSIHKLLELEEHIWSPMYGLKGNVDATVQVQMQLPSDSMPKTLTVPLELKTGKRDNNEMHRAQTALYTLLLSDRYDINVTSGVLYYLETSKTFRVEGIRNEIRHMIIQRNEVACYVHDKLALPPMIQKEHLCKKCYAQTSCFTYHKLIEHGDANSSGMNETFDEAVRHLGQAQQEFFQKWDDLLTREERDSMKFRRELWTMLSTEREAVGRCFSNVIIDPGSAMENVDSLKINRYTYCLVKRDAKAGFSFLESQITVGEPIVISDEHGHFALANGYVTAVRPLRITVAVDRKLQNARRRQPGFHPEFNQVFASIMDVNGPVKQTTEADEAQPIMYRIDKDEFANGMATARNNILRIMEKDLFRARDLRQLIVEKRRPLFKHASTGYSLSGPASQQHLNADQRRAIEKVMSAKDYALVLGMPGTGKTTTIAHIIRALVSQGKSVLLTSYTHTAVDNILLKIKDDNIPVLRLGATGKIHPDVQQFADLAGIPKKTIAELEHSWTNSKVVATTCLGINHAIFNHRKFDYCIVDEASQITLPVCLGPIRFASTFILVGDHYQLPPLVQNKEAQEGGLNISLFKLLSDMQPTSVVNLEHQYRMAEDIMIFSNQLVYNKRLKCGTTAVASRILQIPRFDAGLEAHHHLPSTTHSSAFNKHCMFTQREKCWLRNAILPERRSVFVNTDTVSERRGELGAPEIVSGSGTRITNPVEAILIAQLLTTLIRCGVPPKTIGVITFYRSQLAVLRATIRAMAGTVAATDVEMHTADKYQGRDKEVILLSCVRCNSSFHVGELLKDWRRMNVALTRAKSKMIIVGSRTTLQESGVPILEGMVKIAQEHDWVLNLPQDAIDSHVFEGKGTQTQTQSLSSPYRFGGIRGGKGESPGKARQRQPLAPTDLNAAGRTGNPKARFPSKTVNGVMDVQKLLDKHPIMRNVADDLLGNIEVD